jgi:hypothetical protein
MTFCSEDLVGDSVWKLKEKATFEWTISKGARSEHNELFINVRRQICCHDKMYWRSIFTHSPIHQHQSQTPLFGETNRLSKQFVAFRIIDFLSLARRLTIPAENNVLKLHHVPSMRPWVTSRNTASLIHTQATDIQNLQDTLGQMYLLIIHFGTTKHLKIIPWTIQATCWLKQSSF